MSLTRKITLISCGTICLLTASLAMPVSATNSSLAIRAHTPAPPAAVVDTPWYVDMSPRLRFHSREFNYPLSAHTFIDHSFLAWAHDGGCNDRVHNSRGNVSKTAMGDGDYEDRQKESLSNGCDDKGIWYGSNDDAAPHDNGGPADTAEGFFLDLEDSYRDGRGFQGDEPVYLRMVSGAWIQYWFHYGKSNIAGLSEVNHEGDWERISIRLSSTNVPLEVEYNYHYEKCTLPWHLVPKYNGHPVIWVSFNSHGSYPAGADPRWYDEIESGPVIWYTGENLDFTSSQAWWPYGGAWGQVGTGNTTTGPQGPHPSRGAPAFQAPTCDMD